MSAVGGKKSVSILLTNYNHAQYLPESLGGICSQMRPADQIIIVDDGSTDDSVDIIRSFASREPNISLLINQRNRGVQYSIGKALAAATTDFVVWAAADDKLLPNFLSENMRALEENPSSRISFSRLATFADGEEKMTPFDETNNGLAFDFGETSQFLDEQALLDRLGQSYLWLSGNTAVVSLDALRQIGGFFSKLKWHSDWYSFYAIALRHGAVLIPQTLAAMRVLPTTYSSAGMKDQSEQLAVLAEIANTLALPEFSDLRSKFRQRPCLFSVFGREMLTVLRKQPRDFDLFIQYLGWHLNHHGAIQCSHGAKTPAQHIKRVGGISMICAGQILSRLTPKSWREG